ncbi:MAG TPA: zeta toxin family protein, partial [Blastocatellia bacterium]|nr:zeta toxin family protein [Blastocatellia bacterium]
QDIVIILTGGGGSGKTTAAQTRPGTESLLSNSNVIYETLLRTQQRGEKLISSVLSAGKRVGIIYVHRPVEAAAVGALIRAKGNGRIYPISKLASGHYESQNTVLTLYQKYMMHTFVGFLVIDNSGDLGDGRISSINLLEMRGIKYSDINEVEQRARKAVNDEYIRRRGTDQEIPGDIYIAFTVSTVE